MTEPPELVQQISNELTNGTYECIVCSDPIYRKHRIWSCQSCFGMLHLNCIAGWADAAMKTREQQLRTLSRAEDAHMLGKFRCPLCQAAADITTTAAYRCYCSKRVDPPMDPMLVPGSCGEPCERRHADEHCPHRCTLLCHPGPCPPCRRTRQDACFCGKASKVVGCSSGANGYECGQVCGKLLDCGNHTCAAPCHEGPCPICTVRVETSCFCGASRSQRRCAEAEGFQCLGECMKKRDCGEHACGRRCHPGACEVCLRTPDRQRFCPCGKSRVRGVRTSCLEPVPSCGLVCEMPLMCGHLCWLVCHDDTPCAPCKEMVKSHCACGNREFTFPCFCQYLPQEEWKAAAEVAGISPDRLPESYPPKCLKACRKKLSCEKHKCQNMCCVDADHLCVQLCTKKLNCGTHRCGQLCHVGECPPCSNTSYERLYCRCRHTWVEPPVPCGTELPRCNHPCIVPRPCGHPANHPCHVEAECPKCIVAVEKRCASHNAVQPYHQACHLTAVSCGKECGKGLTCCGKKCTLVCHAGPCTHKCGNKFPSFADMAAKGKK